MKANSKLDQLDVHFNSIGGNLYSVVYHLTSGKILFKHEHAPLSIGKRKFVKLLDECFANINLNFEEMEMLKQADQEAFIKAHSLFKMALKEAGNE